MRLVLEMGEKSRVHQMVLAVHPSLPSGHGCVVAQAVLYLWLILIDSPSLLPVLELDTSFCFFGFFLKFHR